jgi:PAS domain S-box-containing protein
MSASSELADRLRVAADLREPQSELSVILREVADGITVQDPSGALVYANDAAARQIGFETAEQLLTTPIAEVMARFEMLDERGEPFPLDELPGRLALRGVEGAERTVGYRVLATGEERWSVVRATPVFDDARAVRFAINVFQDITERKRAEDRTRFLAEASELLSSSLDYERTLAQVARLAVPRLGDWCMVYMRAEDGSIERLAVEHAGGRHGDVLERLRAYPFDPDARVGVPAVLRTGEPQLHSDADSALVASDVVDSAPLAANLEQLGIRSWMCVPLTVRRRTIGAISVLAAESGRRFGESDLALTEELSRRAALAVENARLYRQAHETAATLDTLVTRAPIGLAFWDANLRYVRINDALAEINGVPPEEHLGRTLREVLPELAPTLEPLVRRVLETGEPLIDVEVSGETPALPGVTRHWLATYYPVPDAAGAPIGIGAIVSEVTERKRAEEEAEAARQRVEVLAEAGELLASSVDFRDAMSRLARLAVPRLADACTIFLAEDEGRTLVRIGQAHVDQALEQAIASLDPRYHVSADSNVPLVRAFASGEPILLSVVSEDFPRTAVRDERDLAVTEQLGPRSAMALPLAARGQALGVITLSSREPGRYGSADFELGKELASRIAIALDRASLHEEAQGSLALLESVLASAPVGIGFWDAELRYVRVNEALARINGLPADEHIGRTLADVLPELAPQLEPIYRRVLETGLPLVHEETTDETPTRPGGVRHWLASYYPVQTATGEALGIAAVLMEITERKRAEDALHRSEERFRSLVTATTQVIWAADDGGSMVERVPSWEAFTGQRPEEYQGPFWGWLDAVHPDDREQAAADWRQAVTKVEPVQSEYRLRRRDGEYRHMLVSAVPVQAADGSIREWIGTNTDVEDEQRARAAAEEARERLAFLAEASRQLAAASLDFEQTLETIVELCAGRIGDSATVFMIGPLGALERAASRHVDPAKDALIRRIWELYPPRLDARNALADPLENGESVLVPEVRDSMLGDAAENEEHLALLRELADGSLLMAPVEVGSGPVGALTVARSVGRPAYTLEDLELAEELARRASVALDNARLFRQVEDRARAAQALQFIGDGVFLVDRAGVIRLWNPAAAAITGLDANDVVGRSASEAIPGWSACAARVPVADPRLSGAVRPETLPLEIGGQELWLSISGVGFGEGTVFAFRDVTEERGLEKMKSDFVSTVSHELRTPLAAIYGAAVTLRRQDMPLVGDQRDELLGVISSEAERLAKIVNDILWTSRIESGGLQVTIERCDPVALANDIVQAQRFHLPVNVSLDLARGDGVPELAADPDKVRQVLGNLVENAVKYSPDGGHVEVRLEPAGDRVRFIVVDEGLGIPPAEHERVFEKFYRLDPNLTRGVGGTGLGLYICRELVRRMDGRIWVEGRGDGRGSVFVVELPTAPRPA